MERDRHPLTAIVGVTRKQVLDLIEATYGYTPQWEHVRKALLRLFGRDGLEGRVSQYLDEIQRRQHDSN